MTTGPMTRDTRPMPTPAGGFGVLFFNRGGHLDSSFIGGWLSISILHQSAAAPPASALAPPTISGFLSDFGLPGLVGFAGQPLDQLRCRLLTSSPSAGWPAQRRPWSRAVVNAAGDIQRQQLVQHGLHIQLDFVQRKDLVAGRRLFATAPPVADPDHLSLMGEHGNGTV